MSDQIRMSRMVDAGKACNASVALARARQLYGTQSYCPAPIPVANVQLESQRLGSELAVLAACIPVLRSAPTTSGAYTNKINQAVLDASVNPTDPITRFRQYTRFFPTPCPVVGADYLNASMPKPTTACQLPNSPLNPILPA
jgi:hypothetical protein